MTFAEQFPFINLSECIEEDRRSFESENMLLKACDAHKNRPILDGNLSASMQVIGVIFAPFWLLECMPRTVWKSVSPRSVLLAKMS